MVSELTTVLAKQLTALSLGKANSPSFRGSFICCFFCLGLGPLEISSLPSCCHYLGFVGVVSVLFLGHTIPQQTSYPSGYDNFSIPSFLTFLSLSFRTYAVDASIGAGPPAKHCFLHCDPLWVSVIVSLCCRERLL